MKKICLVFLIIGLIIVIGLSIWLGFPSPYYNRAAICVVGYIIGTASLFVAAAIGADMMGQ